jgi:hypothetical protein
MKFGIYRLLLILGHHECLVVYNSRGTSCPVMCIYGLYRPTNVLYKTTMSKFDTFEVFAKKNFFLIFNRVKIWNFSDFDEFCCIFGTNGLNYYSN